MGKILKFGVVCGVLGLISSVAFAGEADLYWKCGSTSWCPVSSTYPMPSADTAPNLGATGGSYRAVGVLPASGAYGGGIAANSVIGSFMWSDSTRKVKIRSFDLDPVTVTAFTTAQYLELAVYPIKGCSSTDSGGTDVSQYFGNPVDSIYPAISTLSFTMRTANSGATGLTKGNCTVGNMAYASPLRYTGTTLASNSPGSSSIHYELHTVDGAPLVLHNGEGVRIVLLTPIADATGSVSEIIQVGFTVEPE